MKLYKKSDLSITKGLIVANNGDIILPDPRIVKQINELETLAQQAMYLSKQPEATPMPSLDGFERMSINDSKVKFRAVTPTMDEKAAEAMAIMDEMDDLVIVNKANELLDNFKELIEFVDQDFVIDCGDMLYCIDTPVLGSLLDLTKNDIVNVIATICGMEDECIEKHEVMVDPFTGDTFPVPTSIPTPDKCEDFSARQHTDSNIIDSLQEVKEGIDDFCIKIEDGQHEE